MTTVATTDLSVAADPTTLTSFLRLASVLAA